jgi:hypothetical protein
MAQLTFLDEAHCLQQFLVLLRRPLWSIGANTPRILKETRPFATVKLADSAPELPFTSVASTSGLIQQKAGQQQEKLPSSDALGLAIRASIEATLRVLDRRHTLCHDAQVRAPHALWNALQSLHSEIHLIE